MPDFLWGAATSSYQVEGGAAEDGRGPSVWDILSRRTDVVPSGDTGDVACDHYHRWPGDIALMGRIGLGAYRFSVSWSRVLPRGRGAINEKGLDFYDRLIDGLLQAKIEPWLCLYHWDLPQALDDLGGWLNRDSVGWFTDYAALLAKRYGDRVKNFATFNEPNVFTFFGYCFNLASEGFPNHPNTLLCMHHVNLGHGAAVDVLRDLVPAARIGGIHNRQPVVPEHDTQDDRAAAIAFDEHWNLAFTDPQILGAYPPGIGAAIEPYCRPGDMARICRPLDWFGLNYYDTIVARSAPWTNWGFGFGDAPADIPRTEIGWTITPDGFRQELVRVAKAYRLPIYVTENGCGSDKDIPDALGRINDQHRIDYLTLHLAAMRQAMAEGADVRGYFAWSLLDNFEWGAGYSQRFGLVHVDYATQVRTLKASAEWYAALIRAGSIDGVAASA